MKYITTTDLTLIEALALLSPESSKTTLRSWLKDGRVTVDGELVKHTQELVRQGQEVALGNRPRYIRGGIRMLYEDRHIAVIEKPAGLLSVATAFEIEETAHGILKDHFGAHRVFVVHRLDQDTSGVMMFALTETARDVLKETFEKHDIERAYTAIVEGCLKQHSGTWESYLYEDEAYMVHSTPDSEKGRLAITHFEVHASNRRYTSLLLKLETGRKNQIRVHCQDAGHPVVGDKKYGATSNPLKRLCLHAHLLAFNHPITKQKMRFESTMPDNFNRLASRGK